LEESQPIQRNKNQSNPNHTIGDDGLKLIDRERQAVIRAVTYSNIAEDILYKRKKFVDEV
jgi:hypothetical protein